MAQKHKLGERKGSGGTEKIASSSGKAGAPPPAAVFAHGNIRTDSCVGSL